MSKLVKGSCLIAGVTLALVAAGSSAFARSPSSTAGAGSSGSMRTSGGSSFGGGSSSSGGSSHFGGGSGFSGSTMPLSTVTSKSTTVSTIPLVAKTDHKLISADPKSTDTKLTDPKSDLKIAKIDPKLDKGIGDKLHKDPNLSDADKLKLDKDLKLAGGDKMKPIDPMFGKKPGKGPFKKFPQPWPFWGWFGPWPTVDFDFCSLDDCFETPVVTETVSVEPVVVNPVFTVHYKDEAGAEQVFGKFDAVLDQNGLKTAESQLTSQGLPWWVTAQDGTTVDSNIGS